MRWVVRGKDAGSPDSGAIGATEDAASRPHHPLPGASGIETIDEPGGGRRVRLTEPNGYTIEIVHGIETVQPIHVVRQPINSGVEPLKRAGEVIRFAAGPSSVKRIGHAVLGSPKNQETVRWFRDTLGLVCSDDVYAGERTTSSASSAGSTPATIMWITTRSSA